MNTGMHCEYVQSFCQFGNALIRRFRCSSRFAGFEVGDELLQHICKWLHSRNHPAQATKVSEKWLPVIFVSACSRL
jgi:hypothetical protein